MTNPNAKYNVIYNDAVETYDVLFYLTPYEFYEEKLTLPNVKLSHLILHVSYSYMLTGNFEKLS